MGSISQQDVLSKMLWHQLERRDLWMRLLDLLMWWRDPVVLALQRARTGLPIYEMVVLQVVLVTEWAVASMKEMTSQLFALPTYVMALPLKFGMLIDNIGFRNGRGARASGYV